MSEMTRRTFFGSTLAGAAVPALSLAATPQSAGSDGVTTDKDVPFGKGGDLELKLDIYRPPKGKEKRMATIHFHGGGFTGGSKDTLNERIRPYAALGYTAIAGELAGGIAAWTADGGQTATTAVVNAAADALRQRYVYPDVGKRAAEGRPGLFG